MPSRLSEPSKVKKPSRIFVCSMGDLWGAWVPEAWIEAVIRAAMDCGQHTFMFLTKNPKRYREFGLLPPNCWVGATVTNQADADERLPWLLQVDAPVRFVSHEPLLGAIELEDDPESNKPPWAEGIDWAIIGAQTGPGAVKPESQWVLGLAEQYRLAGVPLFLKDNIKPVLRCESLTQDYPKT
jgi:protein gp37